MDTLQLRRTIRLLLWFCVGLLIGGYSVASHAAVDVCKAVLNGQIRYYGGGVAAWNSICQEYGDWANAKAVAAGGTAKTYNPDPGAVSMAGCSSTVMCRYGAGPNDLANTGWQLAGIIKTCPDGTAPDRTTGNCVPGGVQCNGDQKLDPATNTCKCDAGKAAGSSNSGMGSSPSSFCKNGCTANWPGSKRCGTVTVNGAQSWTCVGSAVTTGATCTGSGSGSTSPTPGDPAQTPAGCASQGKGSISLNGKTICVDPDPSAPKGAENQETKTGSDGSKTTTNSKTECEGDKCTTTTTTTTTGANGTTTVKTEQQEQNKKTFCQENPELEICRDIRATPGADCKQPPSCDADAVTCAILKQHWSLACMYEVETEESATYAAAKAGTDGFDPDKMRSNAAVVNVNNQFDTSHFLNSSCPQAKPITVMGQTVSLPFDASCEGAIWMGRVAVAMTLVMAAMIVIGGIK